MLVSLVMDHQHMGQNVCDLPNTGNNEIHSTSYETTESLATGCHTAWWKAWSVILYVAGDAERRSTSAYMCCTVISGAWDAVYVVLRNVHGVGRSRARCACRLTVRRFRLVNN